MTIPYPSNYFDPYGDNERAQCVECGGWFEAGDIDDVEGVTCLEFGYIYQGICHGCQKESETP